MANYRELIFEGSLPVVRAFLTGLSLGRRWAIPALCFDDHGIEGESRGHRALEKIKLVGDLTYVAVIDRQAPLIAAAARAAQASLGITIRSNRAVRGAEFEFKFRIFDRQIATRLRGLLGAPRVGVVVALAGEREEVHPDGRGLEAYAPEHDFVFEGRGAARGALPAVLTLREDLRRIEQVNCETIRLQLTQG